MKPEKIQAPEIEDLLPLTPMQEAMLFHYISAAENDLYLEQVCLEIEGRLDISGLTAAWNRVIELHPALRTCFRWKKIKQPVQMVLKRFRIIIDGHDISSVEDKLQEQALESLTSRIRREPLDLEDVPLRVSVVKVAEGRQWMVATYHHILMDGWSNGIVMKQVLDCLRAPTEENPLLEQNAPPFKSYVRWLKNLDQKKQREFWIRYLTGVEAEAQLPEKAMPEDGEGTGCHVVRLEPPLGESLQRRSQEAKTTLAAVVYSAWGLLLARYCDTEDVVFGATVSGRPAELPEVGRMVGLMINTLPLRLSLAEHQRVSSLWTSVSRDLEEREPYSYVSPADVNGLFDTVVVVENYPLTMAGGDDGCGPRVKDARFFERTHYRLTVLVRLYDGIRIDLMYRKSSFGADVIQGIGESLRRILRFMSLSPDEPLSACDLLDSRRKEEILLRFNDTGREVTGNLMFLELWDNRVRQHPDKVAVIGWRDGKRVDMCYGALDERALQVAGYLAGKGCGPGRIVALMMERTPELVIAMIAVLKRGAAYLPIEADAPQQRVDFMLRDSDARFVLRDGSFASACVGNETASTPEDAAYVIYTSGTTGRPKGVVIGHLALANFIAGIIAVIPIDGEDTLLSLTTAAFDIFVLESLLPLSRGSTVCLGTRREQLEPGRAAAMMDAVGATVLQATPSRLRAFMENSAFRRELENLNVLLVGGEPFPPMLEAELRTVEGKIRIFNMYGPTETTVWSTVKEIGGPGIGSIGFPIANTGLFILNKALAPQPPGAPGDLYIGGFGLACGYLNRQELTDESFITLEPGHFGVEIGTPRLYRTGDSAVWEADGSITFIGRRDQQLKIRGFRVEPAEIEHALCRHPGVSEAVVLPREGIEGFLELRAYVVSEDEALPRRLREYLDDLLPAYMIPAGFVAVERIPLTANGKTDHRALAALELTEVCEGADVETADHPVTDHETLVMEIWRQVLGREQIPLDRPFFELGGNSFLLIRVHSRLLEATKLEFPITTLFRHPTVRTLAAYIGRDTAGGDCNDEETMAPAQGPVAVIGMAGRFPGAWTIGQFWENLCGGIESIRRFGPQELLDAGASGEVIRDSLLVNVKGVLPGYDLFDAEFFDVNTREAEMMDPQLRLLHELAWEALEDACIDPFSFEGRIGLFAATMENSGWLNVFRGQATSHSQWLGAWSLCDRDFLATRVAFALNLRGPAMTIQTACSSSLTAVDAAVQALERRRADVALAGGVSFTLEDQLGYPYEEGMVRSADGRCRAFDRAAAGTVGGNGGGMVALKLMEAVDERFEHVEAIIVGSAVNNDGAGKVGYTAPGIEGQADVIRQAMRKAGIDPSTIGYIEAHGTGTKLGDPVEIAGLKAAYALDSRQHIAIGSVKSNIGHLDAAAGVAGLIKTVLAVREGKIPPSLHVDEPNPAIGFESTPFYVNRDLRDWDAGDGPRRGAVSSFGIGGTNAHVIVEAADAGEKRRCEAATGRRRHRLLLLSAKDEAALLDKADHTALFLQADGRVLFEDVCLTLQTGRRHFSFRWAGVAEGREEALDILTASPSLKAGICKVEDRALGCVFLFPGQGTQYGGMAADLYRDEPLFRESWDRCLKLVQRVSPENLYEDRDEALRRTAVAQPLLFAFEYSLARLLMGWGIRPCAMMGHSIGEFVAACLAGVMSLEDASRLVAVRGRLMQAQPSGSMVAVQASEELLLEFMETTPDVSIAAVNTPEMCVISGRAEAVERVAARLQERGIVCRSLHTSHAFHSAMMEPAMEAFAHEVGQAKLHPPKIPFVSNVTGRMITAEQATDPDYWARHLREPVRWSAGLETMMKRGNAVFIEVGPGRTLSTFAVRHPDNGGRFPAVQLIKHPQDTGAQDRFFYRQMGKLWLHGLPLDWRAFNQDDAGRCVSLPTYPFQRQRYWPEPLAGGRVKPFAADGLLYWAGWEEAPLEAGLEQPVDADSLWLVLVNTAGEPLVQRMRERGHRVVEVRTGTDFRGSIDAGFDVDPGDEEHYKRLMSECRRQNSGPMRVAHLWNLEERMLEPALDRIDHDMTLNFYSLIYLIKAFDSMGTKMPLKISIVTYENPLGALAAGPARVIPLEYPSVAVRWVELDHRQCDWDEVMTELCVEAGDAVTALRGGGRFVPGYRPLKADACRRPLPLERGGVYVLTGGLGALGRTVAEYLLKSWDARVVMVNRSPLPAPEAWMRALQLPGTSPDMRRRIQCLMSAVLEDKNLLCLTADVADPEEMAEALDEAKRRFGPIQGAFHCAGAADGRLLPLVTGEWARRVMAPKVEGLLVLDRLVAKEELDFVVAFSSINTVASSAGQTCYTSANAFMDAYCRYRNLHTGRGPFYLSIDWDAWSEAGMAVSNDIGREPLAHPLFFCRQRETGAVIYQSCLHAGDCWLLAEHRVGDRCVLPGTAYLELAINAVALQTGSSTGLCLRDVYFLSPLTALEGEEIVLRTSVREESGGFRFTIQSPAAAGGDPVIHAIGFCEWSDDEGDFDGSLEEMLAGMHPVVCRHDGGVWYGDRWNTVSRTLLGKNRAAAFLEMPPGYDRDFEIFHLHPALLDSATMFAGRCMEEEWDDAVPFGYRKLAIYAAIPPRAIAVAEWSDGGDRDDEALSLDVTLLTPEGRRIASIEGFVMKRVPPVDKAFTLNEELFIGGPGDLDSLEYRDTRREVPLAGEVEVEIVATGLNYKEVLVALGVLPAPDDGDVSFGLECCGIVAGVGPGVTEFAVGDEVICYGDSLFGRYRCLPAAQVVHKPMNVDMYRAAGIPLAFLTAYYGLVELGRLKQGERVLIHSAGGGVGLAAVAIARFLQGEIFATAGSEEKREYLRSLGIRHVMDSRSREFARQVMDATEGKGVHLVLNSLSGDFIELGLSVVAPHGRFIELGLRDIVEDRPLGLRAFRKGIAFMALHVSTGIPGFGDVFRRIVRHIEAGDFEPVMCRVFAQHEAASAFRLLAGSRHMGKLVVARKPKPDTENTHLGLTSGQGLEALLQALRLGGTNRARHMSGLVVTSRTMDDQPGASGLGSGVPVSQASRPASHSRPDLATAFEEPGSALEETLAGIFREFLGLERIGVQDNFFELGATSLDMIQVGNRLKSELKREIAVVKLFNHPTIRSLSEFLQLDDGDDGSPQGPAATAESVKKGKDRLKQRRQKRRGQ